MEIFEAYLLRIENEEQHARMEEILNWIPAQFPTLEPRYAWNQPMFTFHGTFIIGLSVSKHHLSVSPEKHGIEQFSAAIHNAGYEHSTNLFRIKWSDPIPFSLLEEMIAFTINDKAECTTFWRK